MWKKMSHEEKNENNSNIDLMKIHKHRWLRRRAEQDIGSNTQCAVLYAMTVSAVPYFSQQLFILFLFQHHLSLYSLVGKGSGCCWHQV